MSLFVVRHARYFSPIVGFPIQVANRSAVEIRRTFFRAILQQSLGSISVRIFVFVLRAALRVLDSSASNFSSSSRVFMRHPKYFGHSPRVIRGVCIRVFVRPTAFAPCEYSRCNTLDSKYFGCASGIIRSAFAAHASTRVTTQTAKVIGFGNSNSHNCNVPTCRTTRRCTRPPTACAPSLVPRFVAALSAAGELGR